jgi:hypothetical protein
MAKLLLEKSFACFAEFVAPVLHNIIQMAKIEQIAKLRK